MHFSDDDDDVCAICLEALPKLEPDFLRAEMDAIIAERETALRAGDMVGEERYRRDYEQVKLKGATFSWWSEKACSGVDF